MESLRLSLLVLAGLAFLLISSVGGQTSTEAPTSAPTLSPSSAPTTAAPTVAPTTTLQPEPTLITEPNPSASTPSGEDPSSSTTQPGYDCSIDGIFPDVEFCEYYHSCQNGVHAWIKCQSNFLFDLRYNGCNYPEYTDCGNRTRPDGYPGTVTPPEGSTTPGTGYQCPPEDGNYPDPGDCTAFYQCYQGIAYRQRCPFPLQFDIAQQVCNHPGFVDCGDRPIPTSSTNRKYTK